MGKSPGKWIKAVLFGKKSSKSSYPKGREKVANEREVLIGARASENDVAVAPSLSSQLNPYATERDERKSELENKDAANILQDDGISLPISQGIDSQNSTLQDSPYDPERIKQEQAATKAQAAFRGYLARRAFWALKGIIRLQALIRGHLVRRQAVATLCCMMGIVKLQAYVRGLIVRHSDAGLEVQKKCNQMNLLESKLVVYLGVNMPAHIGKLSANAFVRKLGASSPTVMPLRLHYDAGEPNSVWNWLERWSASCFWKPVPQPKKASEIKSKRKQVNGQSEMDTGRPKRSVRRIPPANLDGTPAQATYELDKPKRNLRKVSSHPAESMQENPQNELEKVKRNLRKVHNPAVENSMQSEVEFEKPKQSLEKASSSTNFDIVEQSLNSSSEKTNKETALTVNISVEKMKKEMVMVVNSSDEEKKETAMTVNSSAEKIRKETAIVNSSAEKMKKETAIVNSPAEKMKKETAIVNSAAEKTKKETAIVNSSAEKMKKETAIVNSSVNSSAEKMKKETAIVNSSAEKMKKEMAIVNSSAEKMKKETAVTANNSAEKMRQETAIINSSAEKMKKETAMTVNNSAEKIRQEATNVNSSAEKMKKETAVTINSSAEKMKKEMVATVNGSAEKTKKQMTMAVPKSPDIETMAGPLEMNETSDLLQADAAAADSKPLITRNIKDENTPITNVELNGKNDLVSNENQKSGRKASNPAKQDRTENGPQNSPALPSYMAATESAKAKLRLQGSPRSSQDEGDKNNLSRRQSLPSSGNSKINSQSPRTQRAVQAGKAGSKSDRSLSSRDGNAKATQVEWRR